MIDYDVSGEERRQLFEKLNAMEGQCQYHAVCVKSYNRGENGICSFCSKKFSAFNEQEYRSMKNEQEYENMMLEQAYEDFFEVAEKSEPFLESIFGKRYEEENQG